MKSRIVSNPASISLTASQQAAMDQEIKRQLLEHYEASINDLDAVVLYTLHAEFGFGKQRLARFWEAFGREYDALRKHYELPDDGPWLCRQRLLELGIDVDEWNRMRDKGISVVEP